MVYKELMNWRNRKYYRYKLKKWGCVVFLLLIYQYSFSQKPNSSNFQIQYLKTDSGLEFGLWGADRAISPRPVIFLLANTIDGTLGNEYFRECGNRLARQYGWLCVSLDLPFHGMFQKKGMPTQLKGWAASVKSNMDFVSKSNERLEEILNFLIRKGYVDTSKIVVSGISRGGYLALQFAAYDPRIKSVVAFCPVTNLFALREFYGMKQENIPESFNIDNCVTALSKKDVLLITGDNDHRVGTDLTIRLARNISKASIFGNHRGDIELVVKSEPKGHTIPEGTVDLATSWILSGFKNLGRRKSF